MTTIEAILELMHDARSEKSSKASYKRCLKACETMNLSSSDTHMVMHWLDYWDGEGKPYPHYA
jgi:hypothetical protein